MKALKQGKAVHFPKNNFFFFYLQYILSSNEEAVFKCSTLVSGHKDIISLSCIAIQKENLFYLLFYLLSHSLFRHSNGFKITWDTYILFGRHQLYRHLK